MKILLTGATGYIGHLLAIKLASLGHVVNILVRDPESKNIPLHPNIYVFQGDIINIESLNKAVAGCEIVFHLAAYARLSSKNPELFFQINVTGTEKVLIASLKAGVRKIIYTSSVAVLGPSINLPLTEDDPRISKFENDYELTKYMAEALVKNYSEKGLPGVILNLTRVYGPGINSYSNGVNRFISRIIRGSFTIVPDRQNIVANYVFIDDVINAHLLAMEKGRSGENYIIGGDNISYSQLFSSIQKVAGIRNRIIRIPYSIINFVLLIAAIFSRFSSSEPVISSKILKQLFTNRCVSSQKALSQLGYSVTPIRTGLKKTIDYLTKN